MYNFILKIEELIDDLFLKLDNPYSIPTLVTLLTISCKLLINNKAVALDYKKAIIELPCEFSVLALGFGVSYFNICGNQNINVAVRLLLVTLIIVMINFAITRYLVIGDRIARMTFLRVVSVVIGYIISILIYISTIHIMQVYTQGF